LLHITKPPFYDIFTSILCLLKCFVLESNEEKHHDDKFFAALLSVIEKFPELKIKTIELVANLARQGMGNSE